ncbi:hypothetical protein ACLB2K_015735 [Fragaria x ananassa]
MSAGRIREDKDRFGGSLQHVQEELKMTRATIDEQTCRLDEHDTMLQDQQTSSFFGNKNNLDKLDEFKDRHDKLSLRLLQVEDQMRSQVNLANWWVGRAVAG